MVSPPFSWLGILVLLVGAFILLGGGFALIYALMGWLDKDKKPRE